jgi:uncharacterized Zn finger protein (UPF0148 family)
MPIDKKAYMNEVSGLMLEGWTMLSITCPTSGCENCTLLSDEKKHRMTCANCKTNFVTEAGASEMNEQESAGHTISGESNGSGGGGASAAGSRGGGGSGRGTGWGGAGKTGSSSSDNHKGRGTGGGLSFNLGGGSSGGGGNGSEEGKGFAATVGGVGDAAAPGATSAAAAASATEQMDDFYDGLAGEGFARSPEAKAEARRVDAASAKMGELMLAGWAMLAESCPNPACPSMPLMRKRGQEKGVCILCSPDFVAGGPGANGGAGWKKWKRGCCCCSCYSSSSGCSCCTKAPR